MYSASRSPRNAESYPEPPQHTDAGSFGSSQSDAASNASISARGRGMLPIGSVGIATILFQRAKPAKPFSISAIAVVTSAGRLNGVTATGRLTTRMLRRSAAEATLFTGLAQHLAAARSRPTGYRRPIIVAATWWSAHGRSKSMDVAVSLRGMLIESQQRPTLAQPEVS